jgi:uncharacterized protein
MEKFKGSEIVLAVVVFFLLLFVYTKIAGPIPFTVNNINTLNSTPFEVSGNGKAAAAPDTALINLGVTQTGATVAEAQAKTNEASANITKSLIELGIKEKDIKTTNYSITPDYSFTGERQRTTGYTVTQNFEVKSPIEKTNEVVDSATANGANLVGNISFTLNDTKLKALTNVARQEAVNNAKSSAEGLAKASGIKLGKIINVRESSGEINPRPILMDAKAEVGAGAPTTNITPGESNVEVIVTLTYQTL